MTTRELSIILTVLVVQIIIGLWYMGNYVDYLNNRYLIDGLGSCIKIFIADFFYDNAFAY
jgi:hypothetical protein